MQHPGRQAPACSPHHATPKPDFKASAVPKVACMHGCSSRTYSENAAVHCTLITNNGRLLATAVEGNTPPTPEGVLSWQLGLTYCLLTANPKPRTLETRHVHAARTTLDQARVRSTHPS